MVIRRTLTAIWIDGRMNCRANVWTEKGYSSKTFSTATEANTWLPASERGNK